MATPTSSQSAARQNGTAQSGGKRRKVASQAGVNRYHKPIGSEIGGPRDANHAAIQQDQGARKNYGDLISGDPEAQRKALDGMNTEDLNKLADIAFSFKSSDPKVVQLRIAARNAQARRGIRIKPGQTQTNPGAKPAPSVNYNNRGAAKALSRVGPHSARLIELAQATEQKNTSKLGNFPIPDVAHLRKAVQAIGRAKPEHRPIIARHIIARAKVLKAEHLVSDHIKHYARGHREPGTVGMSRGSADDEVELAGRWKHGYIPLDAEALASKMKGGKGKPWWEGGHRGRSGDAKKALHGSPKSGSPKTSEELTKMVKSGPVDSKPRGAAMDKPKVGTTNATDVNRVSSETPAQLAQRYIQMHGDAGARQQIARMQARKRLTLKDRALLAALKAEVRPGKGAGSGDSGGKADPTPEGVRSAYAKITGGKHRSFVPLVEVRAKLGGTRQQQDAVLQRMERSGDAILAPDSRGHAHQSPEHLEAGIRVGREVRNLIALEPPEEN